MATVRAYYPLLPKEPGNTRERAKEQDGWQIRWKDHYGKWRTKIFRGDERSAKKILQRIVSEVEQITSGLKQAPEQSMSLDKAVEMYLSHLKATKHAPGTIQRYQKTYRVFQGFLPRNVELQASKRRDIERFQGERLKTCTKAGVAIDLRQLRAFFNWCFGLEYINRSPLVGVKIDTSIKPVRFLTADERQALYDVIESDQDAWDLVTFYLSSGARAAEILPPRFGWANVHQTEITLIGKGNKVRHVGLNDTMRGILESRKHLEHPFPFAYDGVYEKIVRKYYRLAGIFEADLHTLRKTAGALLIQAGVDIYRVSKFLGHSSVTVTEKHYVDLLKQDYQDLAQIMESKLQSDTHIIRTLEPIQAHSGVKLGQENNRLKGANSATALKANPRKSSTNSGLKELERNPAGVVELVDTGDLKSFVDPPASSNKYSDLGTRAKSDTQILRTFLENQRD